MDFGTTNVLSVTRAAAIRSPFWLNISTLHGAKQSGVYLEMAGFLVTVLSLVNILSFLKPHGSRESLSLSRSPEYHGYPVSFDSHYAALPARRIRPENFMSLRARLVGQSGFGISPPF